MEAERPFSFLGAGAADTGTCSCRTLVLLASCPGVYPESDQLSVLRLASRTDDNSDDPSAPVPSQRRRKGPAVRDLRRAADLLPGFRNVQSLSDPSLDARERPGTLCGCFSFFLSPYPSSHRAGVPHRARIPQGRTHVYGNPAPPGGRVTPQGCADVYGGGRGRSRKRYVQPDSGQKGEHHGICKVQRGRF